MYLLLARCAVWQLCIGTAAIQTAGLGALCFRAQQELNRALLTQFMCVTVDRKRTVVLLFAMLALLFQSRVRA